MITYRRNKKRFVVIVGWFQFCPGQLFELSRVTGRIVFLLTSIHLESSLPPGHWIQISRYGILEERDAFIHTKGTLEGSMPLGLPQMVGGLFLVGKTMLWRYCIVLYYCNAYGLQSRLNLSIHPFSIFKMLLQYYFH